jgi:rubrerythrin
MNGSHAMRAGEFALGDARSSVWKFAFSKKRYRKTLENAKFDGDEPLISPEFANWGVVWFLPALERDSQVELEGWIEGIQACRTPTMFNNSMGRVMKARELYNRTLFQVLIVSLFGIPFLLLAFNFGCQKQKEDQSEAKQKVTVENLQTAYAKSVNYVRMYNLFARRAEKDRLLNVAHLYRAVARSEQAHADLHAELLHQYGVEPVNPQEEAVTVGTTLQTLKFASSSEEIEYGKMYPNLIHTAELERDSAAAAQFRLTQEVDTQHGELFKEALDRAGRIPKTPYYVCGGCGYIITSEKTDECPICHSKKDKFEKI